MTTSEGSADAPRRAGGPPLIFALIGIGGLLVMVVLLVLTALGIGVRVSGPPPTMGVPGQASEQTHAQVVQALGAASIQTRDPLTPYRPGESPALFNVPRRTVQAILPDEPQGGYILIYELPSSGQAEQVGRDFLAYLGSGTGQVQYPRDTQFVLRQVGQTLVFFPWSPQASTDPRTPDVAAALETLGTPLAP
jgi:hypothetical protein